jgi:hypothetical protein
MKIQFNTDVNIDGTEALAAHREKTSGLPLSETEPAQD